MNETVTTYALYLLLSIPLTVWVARTLHRNGRVFLVDCFHGREELAESVNHLLVVGFYLVNAGFISLYLKLAGEVTAVRGVFEALSAKMGVVLLVLGAMRSPRCMRFDGSHATASSSAADASAVPVRPASP